jgi:hypothetical protein
VYGFIYDFTSSYLPSFGFALCMAILCLTTAYIAINGGMKLRAQYDQGGQ